MDNRTVKINANCNYRKAQVSLELTITIFIMLLLLVATARVFVWLSQRMVLRNQDYEATRVAAGSAVPTITRTCLKCFDKTGSAVQPPDPCNPPNHCTEWKEEVSDPAEIQVNETNYPRLDVFENWRR
ncbi:hypothetical protein ACFL1K_04255 [Candidatus Omnitrophota bacterium]